MAQAPTKIISLETLKANSTRESLYVLIGGKVHDATKFLDEHPGGDDVLLSVAGRDATEIFEDIGHSNEARGVLTTLHIGDYIEPRKVVSCPAPAGGNTSGWRPVFFLFPLVLFGAILAYRYHPL